MRQLIANDNMSSSSTIPTQYACPGCENAKPYGDGQEKCVTCTQYEQIMRTKWTPVDKDYDLAHADRLSINHEAMMRLWYDQSTLGMSLHPILTYVCHD